MEQNVVYSNVLHTCVKFPISRSTNKKTGSEINRISWVFVVSFRRKNSKLLHFAAMYLSNDFHVPFDIYFLLKSLVSY